MVAGMWHAMLGFGAGAILTIPAAVLAVMTGGLGHGSYRLARVVFPYAMMAWSPGRGDFTALHLALALAQFPAYGFALGMVSPFTRARILLGAALILVHMTTAIAGPRL